MDSVVSVLSDFLAAYPEICQQQSYDHNDAKWLINLEMGHHAVQQAILAVGELHGHDLAAVAYEIKLPSSVGYLAMDIQKFPPTKISLNTVSINHYHH